jgi:hypothetical protein
MKKPPELTVVGPAPRPDPLAPPDGLGEAGARLWNNLHHDFEITDASGLAMLHQICCTVDKVAEYSAAIERDGAVLRTKTGLRDHPLIRHVLTGRSFIVRSLHKLGLDIIAPRSEVGRPSSDYRGEHR